MKIDFEYLKKDEYFIHLMSQLKILEIEKNKLKEDYDKAKILHDEIDGIDTDICEIIDNINNINSYIELQHPGKIELFKLKRKKRKLKEKLSDLKQKLQKLKEKEENYECEFCIIERKYFNAKINYRMKDIEIQNYIREKLSNSNPVTKKLIKEENH